MSSPTLLPNQPTWSQPIELPRKLLFPYFKRSDSLEEALLDDWEQVRAVLHADIAPPGSDPLTNLANPSTIASTKQSFKLLKNDDYKWILDKVFVAKTESRLARGTILEGGQGPPYWNQNCSKRQPVAALRNNAFPVAMCLSGLLLNTNITVNKPLSSNRRRLWQLLLVFEGSGEIKSLCWQALEEADAERLPFTI
nr:hypothetical protein Iba_chr03bCG4360 [Ipomoea batatas]